ncbi:MAG: aldo/keto reductase [Polyangiaceae bacterium]|nr:aldo/keto reductase [Polyangiaceae bacterium]
MPVGSLNHSYFPHYVANQKSPALGADGILDYCRLHNITIQAWAPLARGRALGGTDDPKAIELARVVSELARAKDVPNEAIAIAWLLRHPAGIQPVIGSTEPARIKACCAAECVTLSREEWYSLYVAGRGARLP